MAFRDLSLLEIISDPESGEKLVEAEPWLFSCGDDLYPTLCGTPVLQPGIDRFLKNEAANIARAFAELAQDEEARQWYATRYGFFHGGEPHEMDTEVLGEGYPGFWDVVEMPEFMHQLHMTQPESLIIDVVGKHHYQIGLDLGCGQGGMTQQMANACRQVIGLEQNFYLAATANKLLAASEIPVHYHVPERGRRTGILSKKAVENAIVVCGDVRAMPFCEPLFDWVHCGHFLDLVDDPARVLINVQKIMKPGATLSLCSPWDFPIAGHFDGLLDILESDFTCMHQSDGMPWIRFSHKRKMIVHEDWLWVGKMKK